VRECRFLTVPNRSCSVAAHCSRVQFVTDRAYIRTHKGNAVLRPIDKGKNIGHEALNIKGIARTRMAKSTHDAGWGQFLKILSVKAERAGLMAIAVNPNGTTQNCSACGQKVPKTIQERWHSCPNCGCELDRDHNAAINIKHRAVGHPVLKAQETPDGMPGVTEKPALYA